MTTPITFETEPCGRCGGTGRLEQYGHVAGGVCAKCGGSKVQLSRRGRAAHRAYELALDARLGLRADQVEEGQVLNEDGRPRCIDQIETETTTTGMAITGDLRTVTVIRFFTRQDNGRYGSAHRPESRVRRYDPQVEAEVAAQIAARYSGATLAAPAT
ncbi:hypothetical protein [Thermomonospora cellulosilytica]|uniref:Uncharacterized protein n=1 Tax=Thermomonospora cellulosilytica TaxID=1411118 RepID=A0A7W3N1M0_9ACTN|nr:hypothetical protein [Thermomonospora cellulosilytica]MBA9005888.1 hypothetical protein [Thermomonospora cellulosilytica]